MKFPVLVLAPDKLERQTQSTLGSNLPLCAQGDFQTNWELFWAYILSNLQTTHPLPHACSSAVPKEGIYYWHGSLTQFPCYGFLRCFDF